MSKALVPRGAHERQEAERGRLDALVGAARYAAGTWVRTAGWSLGVSFRLVRASSDPRTASALARDVTETLRGLVRELLDVSDRRLDDRIKRLLPAAAEPVEARGSDGVAADAAALRQQAAELLRQQAAELLRQAADVDFDEVAHPAYARILLELAPDEARILRLLTTEGAQPAVDVRETQLIGSGQVVADGLNMIGASAGCRHSERVTEYLSNLNRLGLVRFAREPLQDAITYQALEAQPHVLEAVKRASRARTVQRSIRLTPFGVGFCKVCMPVDEDVPSPGSPG